MSDITITTSGKKDSPLNETSKLGVALSGGGLEGSVAETLRATSSVPGVFAPLEKGEQQLVDGGLLNNLPVDVFYKMGANVVLAIDVTNYAKGTVWQDLKEIRYLPSSLREATAVVGASADLLIRQQRKSTWFQGTIGELR
jgi:predicted acylesterase/phospholipase RssA